MPLQRIILSLSLCLPLGCLAGCSGGGSGTGSQKITPPPLATPYLYTAGIVNGNAVILSFPASSTGTKVVPTLAATVGSADVIASLRTDGAGNLYAMTLQNANYSEVNVYVYGMSNGTLTLKRSFFTNAGLGCCMTVDKTGVVYMGIQNGALEIFAATASGTVAPTASYPIAESTDFLTTDSNGYIYGLNHDLAQVDVYAPGFSSPTPIKQLSYSNLNDAPENDIAVDSLGNIYIAEEYQILIIPAGATSPTSDKVFTGSAGLQNAVTVDSSNRLWTSNDIFGTSTKVFDEYNQLVTGNNSPISTFTSVSPDFTPADLNRGLVIY
jgi:hypothetical protein